MQVAFGIALQTIIKSIYYLMLQYDMESSQKSFIIERLGDIEYRISIGCD